MTSQGIAAQLNPDLRDVGFGRKGLRWNRSVGEFIDVIELQTAKTGGSLTVNLGIFDPVVDRLIWNGVPRPWVGTIDCVVETRLGFVVDGRDRWWRIDDDTASTLASVLHPSGIDWLAELRSRPAMVKFLQDRQPDEDPYPLTAMKLAVLQFTLGNRAEAERLIDGLRRRANEGWLRRIEELAFRMQTST